MSDKRKTKFFRVENSSSVKRGKMTYSCCLFTGSPIGRIHRAIQPFGNQSHNVVQRYCWLRGSMRFKILWESWSREPPTVASSRHDFPTGDSHGGSLRCAQWLPVSFDVQVRVRRFTRSRWICYPTSQRYDSQSHTVSLHNFSINFLRLFTAEKSLCMKSINAGNRFHIKNEKKKDQQMCEKKLGSRLKKKRLKKKTSFSTSFWVLWSHEICIVFRSRVWNDIMIEPLYRVSWYDVCCVAASQKPKARAFEIFDGKKCFFPHCHRTLWFLPKAKENCRKQCRWSR